MKTLISLLLAAALLTGCLAAADTNVAGTWEMTMDSPHGKLVGPLTLKQEGGKITGTYETEPTGKLALNGTVDGEKILFTIEAPGGQMTITFEGARDGDKLSGTTKPLDGAWSAVRK